MFWFNLFMLVDWINSDFKETFWFKYRCGISVVWLWWLYWVKSKSLGTPCNRNYKIFFPIQATSVTGRQITTALNNSDTSEFFIILTWFVTSENPAKNIQRSRGPDILFKINHPPNWTLCPGTNYDVMNTSYVPLVMKFCHFI